MKIFTLKKIIRIVFLLLASFGLVGDAYSTTYFWVGTAASWSTLNWATSSAGPATAFTPSSTDDVVFDGGGTDCAIDVAVTVVNFTMAAAYISNITFSGVTSMTTTTFTCSGGTYDATGADVQTLGAVTVNGGTLLMSTAGGSQTFSSLTVSSGTFDGGSTSQIIVQGTVSPLASLSGGILVSTSGELALDYIGNATNSPILLSQTGGTFTHNSGLVSFTLEKSGTHSASSGITFSSVTITNPSSLSPRTISFGAGTTTIDGIFAITSLSTRGVVFSGGSSFNINGDLDLSSHNGTVTPTHTATFNFTGSGAQTITGNSGGSTTQGKIPSVVINKTGGSTLAMNGNINISGTWSYTAGTAGANSSTVSIYGIRTINSGATIPFNNLNILGTITLNGTLSVSGTLTIGSGNSISSGANALSTGILTNNGTLTLGSTLTTTGNLTNNVGATITTNGNAVSVGGDLTNSGTLTNTTSTFTLTGSNGQSINFGANHTINTLVVNKSSNTATISNTTKITNLLTSTSGTLNANGNVTLVSNTSGTASVGPVSGTLSGNFIVQRYIQNAGSGLRRFRFLAAPVTAASGVTIRAGWQANIFVTGGTGGTGPVGLANYNAAGYDWTASNAPSLFTFAESSNTWTAMSSNTTTTALTAGTGYRVFVRGDRSTTNVLDGSNPNQSAVVTLNLTGNIQTGTVTPTITNGTGGGWNLIGNPYPGVLDWNALQSTNSALITGTYYTWDPNSGAGAGAYVSWNGTTGSATRYISSGQSFWVIKSAAGSSSLTINEAHKSSNAGGNMFKTNNVTDLLKLTLSGPGIDYNDAYVHFRSDAFLAQDQFDAIKKEFANGQIATYIPGTAFYNDINSVHAIGESLIDTINIYVKTAATATGSYAINFSNMQSFQSGTVILLEDLYSSAIQNISLNPVYHFTVSSNLASTGANRLRLIVGGSSALPVVLSKFNAEKTPDLNVKLLWSTASEINNDHFDVERSFDQVNFIKIGQVKGHGNSTVVNNYQLLDASPNTKAINYYRLKQTDFNGKFEYSPVLPVNFNNDETVVATASAGIVNVFPNPATNNINITLNNDYQGDVTINIYNLVGKLVSSTTGTLSKSNIEISQNISNLNTGIYLIEVSAKSGEFREQSKFVKE